MLENTVPVASTSLLTKTKNLITNNLKPIAAIAAVGTVVYVVANKVLGDADETTDETNSDI